MCKKISIIMLLLVVTNQVVAKTQFAKVNDVTLAYEDSGKGDVVVVFDAGFGTPKSTWQSLVEKMNPSVRTISYSRAGIGQSSSIKSTRSISQHVDDLRGLLEQLAVKQPIIYVSHSYSGLMAAEFAKNYAQQLHGLLLIDPATFAQQHQFKKADKARVEQDVQMLIKYMPKSMVVDYQFLLAQLQSAPEEVVALPNTIPTTILTASVASEKPFVFSETAQGREIWIALHKALISNPAIQKQYLLTSSGHNIHLENPKLVVNSINELIKHIKL